MMGYVTLRFALPILRTSLLTPDATMLDPEVSLANIYLHYVLDSKTRRYYHLL